ncbi:unnamed protein product [Sphenostylis stenocarpa]|uniref:Uncharacterized protein n=1 Tax=Sphenostylis stenocarpa TaxID=92480 RepID=A0AA87B7P9_9FABA|nr:unnamed protein product [Sphenostylis stenocarpa]
MRVKESEQAARPTPNPNPNSQSSSLFSSSATSFRFVRTVDINTEFGCGFPVVGLCDCLLCVSHGGCSNHGGIDELMSMFCGICSSGLIPASLVTTHTTS